MKANGFKQQLMRFQLKVQENKMKVEIQQQSILCNKITAVADGFHMTRHPIDMQIEAPITPFHIQTHIARRKRQLEKERKK